MIELLISIIGVLFASGLALGGYAIKTRSDADGWKVSYEREKFRADDLAAAERDNKLSNEIATKVAAALHAALTKEGDRA